MAEQSGFFNAHFVNGEYDRTYLADSLARYFASFIGNGIFGGKLSELIVSQHTDSGMKIEVLPGRAWINGYWYENTSNLSLDVEVADGVLNRIDAVVVRWDNVEREVKVVVKKGTFASNAVAPTLQRDSDCYELKLAEIYVKAGTTSVAQINITDTRLDSSVCGIVTGIVEQIDATEFGAQLNSYIKELSTQHKNNIDNLEAQYAAHIENLQKQGTIELEELLKQINAFVEDESLLTTLGFAANNAMSEAALLNQTLGYTKKNLIPYPFVNTVGDVAEFAGVTWTDLGDGTVKGNGTASANSYFTIYEGGIYLRPGKYMLTSGFDDNTTAYVFFVKIHKTSGEYAGRTTSAQKLAIEITESDIENYNILISTFLATGASLSNVIMKPMLRRAEILNETWEPYKLSVYETIREDEVHKGCFYRINNVTGIKEWFNAPNVPGVEYCLVEKWNDETRYQKTFYVSTLPNTSVTSLETGTQWDKIVSTSGYALDSDDLTHYPFPVTLQNQVIPIAVINKIESDGALVITTTADASHLKAYITVKYTKS